MQKFSLSRVIREEVIRGITFATTFLVCISLGFASIAYAADGGRFGEILNMILASGDWETDTTGTVKNSEKLGGKAASDYVSVAGGFSCASPTQCIYGIDGITGVPLCR